MWGSSLADLAKKAQELQEQATEAASSLSATTGSTGLFNLDAMKEHEDDETKPAGMYNRPLLPPDEPVAAAAPAFSMDRVVLPATPKPRPPQAAAGKLRVPSSSSKPSTMTKQQQRLESKTTAAAAAPRTYDNAPLAGTASDKQSAVDAMNDDDDMDGEGEGWDEVDLDLVDSKEEVVVDKKEPVVAPDSSDQMNRANNHVSGMSTEPNDVITAPVVETEKPSEPAIPDNERTLGQDKEAEKEEEEMIKETAKESPAAEPALKSDDEPLMMTTAPVQATLLADEEPVVKEEPNAPEKKDVVVVVGNGDHHASVELATESIQSQDQQEPFRDWKEDKENDDDEVAPAFDNNNNDIAENADGDAIIHEATTPDAEGAPEQAKQDEPSTPDHSTPPVMAAVSATTTMDRQTITVGASSSPAEESTEHDTAGAGEAIPDDQLLEQFSQQMKRLEENHQAERQMMEQEHALQLQEALTSANNHDACQRERLELEERLGAQIHEKEEQLHELMRRNEGYKLKLDVLKREVAGTQELLSARDVDLGKASEEHSRNLKELEQKLQESEERVATVRQEAQSLKAALESTESDLGASRQEHADLKARVKVVAAELKDRRVECRELHAKVGELNELNGILQSEASDLQERLSHQNISGTEKDEEMEQLRAKLVDAASDLKRAEAAANDREARIEKNLAEYKKKAQNSLALANSRTAAAVQAREEAELEARAARSTADTAMERAVRAEIASKEALAEAKAYVKEMEQEKSEAVGALNKAKDDLTAAEDSLANTRQELQESLASSDLVFEELKVALASLEEEKSKVVILREELLCAQEKANELHGDIATLREQLQRNDAPVPGTGDTADESKEKSPTAAITAENGQPKPETANNDATIMTLQRELREANDIIDDLRDALKNAVEINETKEASQNGAIGSKESHESSNRPEAEASNGGTDSAPLFYAMEKQAELKTARNEISRLSNLLADVQSEKMEACEAMDDMRRRMEEAEARLKRFEKLHPATGSDAESPSDSVGLNGSSGHGSRDSSAVNIEYLKNIMLSYLNAKTLAERKALVPVIGAVLCLTADEEKAAMQNVEESASLGGVSHSLFESISGRLSTK